MPLQNPQSYIQNVDNPLNALNRGLELGEKRRRAPILEAREQEALDRQKVLQGREDLQFSQQQIDREANPNSLIKQQQKAQEFQADMGDLLQNQSTENFAAMLGKYPELQEQIRAPYDELDKANKASSLLNVKQFSSAIETGNIEVAKTVLEDNIEALRSVGRNDEADVLQAMDKQLDVNPQAAQMSAGLYINAIEPQSISKAPHVSKAVTYNDGTTLSILSDNKRVVRTPEGEVVEGKAAAQAMASARKSGVTEARDIAAAKETGKLGTQIELGAEAAGAVASGKQAIGLSKDLFDNATTVNKGITAIDRALGAIERDARSGIIYNMLPSLSEASAELESSLNELGLNVVAGTTFGALSAGELRLALNTAAPRDLNPQELKKWLTRKREANVKLASEMNKAAKFLANPKNTLFDWLESNSPEEQTPESGLSDLDLLEQHLDGLE